MKRRRQKGFTLLEVMIASFMSAIVILAAGTVLVTGQTFWNRAWQETDFQRDASYAMFRMSSAAKAATSAREEENGKAIKIYSGADWEGFSCVEGTNDLKYHPPGGAEPETIINGNVENLEFKVEGNRVTIVLELKKGNLETRLVSTVMMRNYGG